MIQVKQEEYPVFLFEEMRFRAGMDSNNPLEIGGTNKSLVFELKELHLDQNGNKKMKTKDLFTT